MLNNLLFSSFYLITAIIGVFIIIFANNIKIFVNKFDPLKIGYNETYFKVIGTAVIIFSIIFALIA